MTKYEGRVLVSHTAKFIYLKTFKSAGTSVEAALEPACRPDGADGQSGYYNGPEGIVAQRGRTGSAHVFRPHADARIVRRQVGAHIWDSYAKVAAVRDPYAKAVSMFWHQHHREGLIGDETDPQSAIDGFRKWIAVDPRLPRDALRVSLHGTMFLDFVIRYEHLEADVAAFGARQGFAPAPVPRIHTNMRKLDLPHQAYYDKATAARVAAHYTLDFLSFGYDVEGWHSDRSADAHQSAA